MSKPKTADDPDGEAARCGDCGRSATRICQPCNRPVCDRCWQVHDPAQAWDTRKEQIRERTAM